VKRVLVTGGAKGLGAAIASALSLRKIPVVVHYSSSKKEAEALKSRHPGLELIYGDFSTPEGTEAFIVEYLARFGDTDGLVNNAGNYLVKSADETDDTEWRSLLQLNFHAPVAITNALLPSLTELRGAVLNIGVAGLGRGRACCYSSAYSAAKEALLHYTRSLAKKSGLTLRTNMLSPGYLENSDDPPGDSSLSVPLEEAAEAACFLLNSPSITGQNLEIAKGVRL